MATHHNTRTRSSAFSAAAFALGFALFFLTPSPITATPAGLLGNTPLQKVGDLDPVSSQGDPEDFFEEFSLGTLDGNRWFTAGYWLNPQPFNSGFDPGYWTMYWKTLALNLEKTRFLRGDWDAPYTGGEIRSQARYSSGCYSVCMKPTSPSGTSTSFYIQDFGVGEKGETTINEIDIEFIGKDNNAMQTNFFSRTYDPEENSGSGNEEMHDLGFNAARQYAAYSFKWTQGRITWWVNGRQVRSVSEADYTIPKTGTKMRIAAGVWVVNKQAEEWAGPVDQSFRKTEARYQWIWHQTGDDCQVKMDCGVNGDPDLES